MAAKPNSLRKGSRSNSNPPGPLITDNPGSSARTNPPNKPKKTLNSALKVLQGGLKAFPPLKSAVDELLECTMHLEIADRNQEEYKQLAWDLASLAQSLQTRLSQSEPTHMPFSIENVARAISEQARRIQLQQDRLGTRRFAAAREDEEDILECYRRVAALFNQLQTDISLCTWDVVQEQQMETRLKGLMPADDAWYNSALAAAMTKRQACTPNTRTKVLSDAHNWTRGENSAKIYWMNGMAGTGKTTIAYSLCKKLEDEKQLGASFFCSRDSRDCQNVNKILPTIAYQLGRYSNPFRGALCNVLKNDPDVAKKDIETQFQQLIAKPFREMNKAMPSDVVVVIDALDECLDIYGTEQVLGLLLHHAGGLPIKFFVTSRPEPSITHKILPHDDATRSILHLHNIEHSVVEADIKVYLREALSSAQFSTAEIDQLASRAGNLFIFAATSVRYILPIGEVVNHRQRLATVLGLHQKPGNKSYRDIDKLYLAILSNAFDEDKLEDEELVARRQVLWTVVCAKEPLTMVAIAELLRLEDDQDVQRAVQPLQSVLHVSESGGVVSALHASFPDFLLSKKRAGSLYYDEVQHNSQLATCCFELMKQSLRFNICGLETSYRFDKDVPDLQNQVNRDISPGLFYASRYWGDHLFSMAASNMSTSLLDEFLRDRLLFWMEVLNLKGCIGHGVNILSQALSWLPTDEASTELRQFAYDACNFVTRFAGNPTSLSTPHIYLSVLPLTPKRSRVWTNYWPRMRGLIRVEGTGIEARGNAALASWTVGSWVNSIAQSGDGKRIVSGSSAGTVSIWDVSNGVRIVGPLLHHQFGVNSVAFSSDCTRIASCSDDRTIRIWDARNGSLIAGPLNGHTGWVLSVAFSADGSRLVSGSRDRTLRVWDARDGSSLGKAFRGHQKGIRSVAFSPDNKYIVSGSDDGTIGVWDSNTGVTTVGPFEGHTGSVCSVAFCPDGFRIVSRSSHYNVRVWEAHTGEMLLDPVEGHFKYVTSVAFSPDGTRVVSGSQDHTIRIWDPQNGELLAGPFQGHRGHINSVLFSPDGTRILSGSANGTVCVWDARHGATSAAKSSGYIGEIRSVAFSPDGTRTVSGSLDCTIRVWDTRNGRLVVGPLTGHSDVVNSVAFSPDGAQIVSGSGDHTLRTWDALTGTLLAGPFKGHTGAVTSVAFSPDGSRIASGSSDHTIRVWDSQTEALAVDPLEGRTFWVTSVAFSPDGTYVVSGSCDDAVRMWNVREGTGPIWTSKAHTHAVCCVAFSPDGTRVVSGSNDHAILVLNALDGTVVHGPFKEHTSYIRSVAFSPDGTRIVSGSEDHTVRVWDVYNGGLLSGPFKGHTKAVRSVAFSPDGRRVVSGSDDCTIQFWEVPTAGNLHATYSNQCTLRDDGWVTDSDSQLLMWLPPDLHTALRLPRSGMISVEGTVMAGYKDLLMGEHWHECYYGPSATGTAPS